MNKENIVKKVIAKLYCASDDYDRKQDELDAFNDLEKETHTDKLRNLSKKLNKLTPENAIEYARAIQKWHRFEVPENPNTKKVKEHGTDIIYVELDGHKEKDWLPVWWDSMFSGLYAEY